MIQAMLIGVPPCCRLATRRFQSQARRQTYTPSPTISPTLPIRDRASTRASRVVRRLSQGVNWDESADAGADAKGRIGEKIDAAFEMVVPLTVQEGCSNDIYCEVDRTGLELCRDVS